MYKQAIDYWL